MKKTSHSVENIFSLHLPHANAIQLILHQDFLFENQQIASAIIRILIGDTYVSHSKISQLSWSRHDSKYFCTAISYCFPNPWENISNEAKIEILNESMKVIYSKLIFIQRSAVNLEDSFNNQTEYGWVLAGKDQKLFLQPLSDNTSINNTYILAGRSLRSDVTNHFKNIVNAPQAVAYHYENKKILKEHSCSFIDSSLSDKNAIPNVQHIKKLLREEFAQVDSSKFEITRNVPPNYQGNPIATNQGTSTEVANQEILHPISVIVPVYKGIDETIQCIKSLCDSLKFFKNATIILGIDRSDQQEEMVSAIQKIKNQASIKTLIHNSNMGFVGNVNKCFSVAASHTDIILLNSDTICPHSDWMLRLQILAYQDKSVATVTPFGSSATIYSFPTNNQNNSTILGLDTTTVDTILRESNARDSQHLIPTCHGFCVYLKRTAIKDFNELFLPIWGKGYGEENCLSMRLAQNGWLHVCATNVFLFHHESISFDDSLKKQLKKQNQKNLDHLYPNYRQNIQEFIESHELDISRQIGILSALKYLLYSEPASIFSKTQYHTRSATLNSNGNAEFENERDLEPNSIHVANTESLASPSLWVSHSRGGGTHKALCDQITNAFHEKGENPILIQSSGTDAIELKIHDPSRRVCHIVSIEGCSQWFYDELERIICPSYIFVHSLVDASYNMIEWLDNTSSPMRIFIHDYHWICPLINLVDYKMNYCGGKTGYSCEICIAKSPNISNSALYQIGNIGGSVSSYRSKFLKLIAKSEALICPTQSTADHISHALHKYAFKFNKPLIRPHEILAKPEISNAKCIKLSEAGFQDPTYQLSSLNETSKHLNIVCIGGISEIKGFSLLLDFCKYAHVNSLNISIRVIGFTCDDERLLREGGDRVSISGKYDDEDLGLMLSSDSYTAALFLSICPETYSYTLTAAVNAGLCPIVTPRGALLERCVEMGVGIVLSEKPTPEELHHACRAAANF